MGLNFNAFQMQQCFRLGRDDPPPHRANAMRHNSGNDDGGARARPRPIFIMFNCRSQKSIVMRRRHKLRDTGVFVNHNFSPAIEKDRRRIYPIIKKARSLEHYADKVRQRDDKLILDGKEYGVDDFDDLPDDIHPRNICTETRGDITFFFRMDSPLSNHHPCKIQADHQTFNCVEQGYFFNKAVICGDDHAKGRIMEATDPGTQKSIGDRIKETPTWLTSRIEVMERICTAKFVQNGFLRDFLVGTKKTYLAEDSISDGYWGIKMSRNNPRSTNIQNFKSNNLGKILMRIRDNLA
jgi:hypothetical protein